MAGAPFMCFKINITSKIIIKCYAYQEVLPTDMTLI